MLIEQRRWAANLHRRQRKPHGKSRRHVLADHRMFDLLQPLAHTILLAIDELADGVERRRGEVARLRFVGEIGGIELRNEFGESSGNLAGMLITVSRTFPFRSRE